MSPIVKQHKSGITTVLFNTRDKWMPYSLYYGGNSDGAITAYCDTFDGDHLVDRLQIDLPTSCKNCVKYVMQEKDQIEILFLPRNMLDI
jgi:hypothetical protein